MGILTGIVGLLFAALLIYLIVVLLRSDKT